MSRGKKIIIAGATLFGAAFLTGIFGVFLSWGWFLPPPLAVVENRVIDTGQTTTIPFKVTNTTKLIELIVDERETATLQAISSTVTIVVTDPAGKRIIDTLYPYQEFHATVPGTYTLSISNMDSPSKTVSALVRHPEDTYEKQVGSLIKEAAIHYGVTAFLLGICSFTTLIVGAVLVIIDKRKALHPASPQGVSSMPANHKVSVGWQIVFTFIPVVDIWAFHRIGKLRKFVLYIFVPSIVLGAAYAFFILSTSLKDPSFEKRAINPWFLYTEPIGIVTNVIGWGLTALTIYLVIIWSRQHNRQFEQPTTSSGS